MKPRFGADRYTVLEAGEPGAAALHHRAVADDGNGDPWRVGLRRQKILEIQAVRGGHCHRPLADDAGHASIRRRIGVKRASDRAPFGGATMDCGHRRLTAPPLAASLPAFAQGGSRVTMSRRKQYADLRSARWYGATDMRSFGH